MCSTEGRFSVGIRLAYRLLAVSLPLAESTRRSLYCKGQICNTSIHAGLNIGTPYRMNPLLGSSLDVLGCRYCNFSFYIHG